MNRFWKALGLVIFCAAFAYGAADATISGVVKDPAGAPFRGAFVHAQNVQSKITVNVMSDNQGRYRIQNLPPGEYQVRVTATGYAADPRTGVKLAAGDTSSLDFALQQGDCALGRSFLVSRQSAAACWKRQRHPERELFCLPRIPIPHGRGETRPRRLDASGQLHAHHAPRAPGQSHQ